MIEEIERWNEMSWQERYNVAADELAKSQALVRQCAEAMSRMPRPTQPPLDLRVAVEALKRIAAVAAVPLSDLPDHGQPNGWRDIAVERIDIAREALSILTAQAATPARTDDAAPVVKDGLAGDVRDWLYFPIAMPLNADGNGPAEIGKDAARMTYEVWDQACASYGSFAYLPDAINEAMRLNAAISPTPERGEVK